ncbi:GtrA family protein [Terrabacter sp. MAHUQ-38]|uniref:GtrA family protein n=1 Tax=unclassified Terrabacter TaxID=2630222 RepID=UPI00165E8327|nr:GtrA family protein [Terrabacter sp. MAHUQ-38]MBC9822507.1 GtrA family protein [Terrabacter sp. MAHUQ-38]
MPVTRAVSLRPADADLGWLALALRDTRVRFVVTGAANAALTFGAFVFFQYTLGERWGYLCTVVATHVTTVLVGFVSHRRLVFEVTGNLLRDLWRFETVHLSNMLMTAALLSFGVEALGMPVIGAQAIILTLSAVCSWFAHSRFSFRR